jgi:hypothetical protein
MIWHDWTAMCSYYRLYAREYFRPHEGSDIFT